ncbi:unnamed protein product [Calypogeia fissa]
MGDNEQNSGSRSTSQGTQAINVSVASSKGYGYSDSEKLDGSKNFMTWSFKVSRLMTQEKVWIELIDPDSAPPAMTVAELAAKREKAINIIALTVKDHIIPIVKRFVKDPRKLWAELKERFETTALGKQLVLRGKLDQIKMSEGMPVEEYARELDHIVSLLADIDLIVEDRELIRIALSGLPESWAGFTTSMNPIIHKDQKMSFACFVSYMQAEELQRAIREMKRQNSGGSNEEALYGHWEPECLKKIEGQIKDLQIKHSEIKKGKHHVNIAEAEVVEPEDDVPTDGDLESNSIDVNFTKSPINNDWLVDSGASMHITGNRSTLSKFIPYSKTSKVTTALGTRIPIAGNGCTKFGRNKVVRQVLYVLGMQRNLLSVGQLTDLGHRVVFDSADCFILKSDSPKFVPKQDHVYLHGSRDLNNGLYRLNSSLKGNSSLCPEVLLSSSATLDTPVSTRILHPSVTVAAPLSPPETSISESELWHKRLSHVNFQRFHSMMSKQLVTGIPALPHEKHLCDSCILAKQHRECIPKKSATRSTRPLQLIHTDLCGPFEVNTLHGARYLLTFIDDFSRYTWVHFLCNKSDTFETFKAFKILVENELQHQIACVRSDRGGEYLSTTFNLFCDQAGIKRQLTAARTPHQNGVAERQNHTLLEAARSLQFEGNIPNFLWDELVKTSNHILNRCETASLHNSTPFETLYKCKPDLSHLKIVGCLAYVHIPRELRKKLSAKSIRTAFMGCDDKSKAFRCYDPVKRKVYISQDVVFNEQSMFDFSSPSKPADSCINSILETHFPSTSGDLHISTPSDHTAPPPSELPSATQQLAPYTVLTSIENSSQSAAASLGDNMDPEELDLPAEDTLSGLSTSTGSPTSTLTPCHHSAPLESAT